jgi:hypothetical protein
MRPSARIGTVAAHERSVTGPAMLDVARLLEMRTGPLFQLEARDDACPLVRRFEAMRRLAHQRAGAERLYRVTSCI